VAHNLFFLLSDEHSPKALGCYGHQFVRTPHLDRLAASGTRFAAAYTPSPICVPARAALAAGRYVHQIGYWDNADAYDGRVRSWHHALRERGHSVVAIGKLHYRLANEDHGFSAEQVPMNIVGGKGDLMGLVRDELAVRKGAFKMAAMAGPGESPYTLYDRDIAARAQTWLREEAMRLERPWVLFVSFVAPHFPLTAPPEHYYPYVDLPPPPPKLYAKHERPAHPFLEDYRRAFPYDEHFDAASLRRALAGYYGLCSLLDEHVGKVLGALRETGLDRTTRVLYTSDHGDNLGARGLWGKSTMYEESVGIPLIVAGPGVPSGVVSRTPVSLLDVVPFIFETVGAGDEALLQGCPGESLLALAARERDRCVFAEYHAMGSREGAFMVRDRRFKYVHYPSYPAQLFDLEADPEELRDLGGDARHAAAAARLRERLYAICDPLEVDRRAKRRQAELLALNGGREAVLRRGDLGFSPVPGMQASFN
jgi:choline-sulfatase